jgi:uncharacterized integral membrane protein
MAERGSGVRRALARARLAVALFLVVLVLIVLFQNFDDAPFQVLFWQGRAPLVALLAAAAGVGALVGALAMHALLGRRP